MERRGKGILGCVLGLVLAVFVAGPGSAAQDELRALCAKGAGNGDVTVCTAAAKAYPDDLTVQKHYGRALYVSGKYAEAITVFEELAKRQPDSARAHLDLAGVLASLKQYPEAVGPIRMALKIDPDSKVVHRTAAIIFRSVKLMEDAFASSLAGAKLGDHLAMYETAWLMFEGTGTKVDEAAGVVWLEKAAEAGHVSAMKEIAEIYLDGLRGQKPDREKAVKWAKIARANRYGN